MSRKDHRQAPIRSIEQSYLEIFPARGNDLRERDEVVRRIIALKKKYPGLVAMRFRSALAFHPPEPDLFAARTASSLLGHASLRLGAAFVIRCGTHLAERAPNKPRLHEAGGRLPRRRGRR